MNKTAQQFTQAQCTHVEKCCILSLANIYMKWLKQGYFQTHILREEPFGGVLL